MSKILEAQRALEQAIKDELGVYPHIAIGLHSHYEYNKALCYLPAAASAAHRLGVEFGITPKYTTLSTCGVFNLTDYANRIQISVFTEGVDYTW